MIRLRRGKERGYFDHGWLKAYHSFSFADYYDPAHMGWGSLRVINEDTVSPGKGFATHSHQNMEIITFILAGTLEHKDSMGNGEKIKAGAFQYMSAGSGVTHSEFNPSGVEPTHLLQIWLRPRVRGTPPRYGMLEPVPDFAGVRLIASPDGADGSVAIHQDAKVFHGRFLAAGTQSFSLAPGRVAYIHVARGNMDLLEHHLEAGDGAAVENLSQCTISTSGTGEFLFFDMQPVASP